MAEISGNQPIGNVPFGDAFLVQTPYTDRITAALQAQQADRRKYESGVTQHVDEQMNKELANVRSVDMPAVLEGYGKWKNISMQMLRPGIQNNAAEYNRLQLEKNAALGQTMAAINRSAQYNAQMKELVAERRAKPSLYNDDFGDRVTAFNATPMDQLDKHPKYGDLSNPDAFRYQGSQTDFNKLEQLASGQLKPVEGAEKIEKLNDLQTRYTPTQFGNTPVQFFENMRGQLAQHIPGRDAAAAWQKIPDDQRAYVDQQYVQISPEKWRLISGSDKPQIIAATDPNNPTEQYAAYRAKLYAINAVPRAGTPRIETNQQAKMGLQFDQRKAMEALREGDRETLASLKHQWKQLDTKQKDDAMNGVVQSMLDDAKAGGPLRYTKADDKVIRQYEIPASTILRKEFSVPDPKGHPILVDAFRLSEDGKSVTPIFYKSGQTGNTRAVDVDISKPMSIGEFKARAAKAMFGVKEAAKEGGAPAGTGASGIKWQ